MVELGDAEGGGEDAGLDDVEACGGCCVDFVGWEWWRGCDGGGGGGFAEGDGEFAPDGYPLVGFEVVVLEEEHEGCGAEEGGVLPVKLGLAQFGRFIRGWLCGRMALNWRG